RAWEDIAEVNIGGTQLLLAAAHQSGAHRVVLASSTHAVGFWPTDTPAEQITPRPDTFYGVSKLAMEALGSVYADRFGMTVVAARIGTIESRPSGIRSLSTWLSFDDFVRLIEATAITADAGFHLVWAISANTRRWFPLEPGFAIGYHPKDDAESFVAEIGAAQWQNGGNGLIGGAFADGDHPLGGQW
ncbi:MAG TPA: NAD(P)-dependent oxidoreductase, partial [Glaciihabitans sp.]|nr:NAD(P)-dependent oxidoreductase [Glaciihabitans sp.]